MTTITATATQLSLPVALATLGASSAPPGGVVSAYVDTSPGRIAGQAYLISVRGAARDLRAVVPADNRDAVEAATTRIDHYLAHDFVPHQPGLALFAAGAAGYFYAVPLPQAMTDELTWAQEPRVGPLEALLDEFERTAVVLFDAARSRIFTIFLNAIESRQEFRDDLPRKQSTGGWFGLEQTHMARHREDHVRQHAERTSRELMRVLRQSAFDRLLLVGPEEALAVLRHELPRPLQARLAGQLELEVFASEKDVLAAVGAASRSIERETEARLVDELVNAGGAHAALGLAATLGALADGSVHLLLMADTFQATGAVCDHCHRLVTDAHHCPTCGQATQPVTDVREAILRQARDQGARVEFIGEPAAERLAEYGGIGAWTRF
ncbi:MAG TPA: host attachment protein [Chloroflexota bacterium]